MIAWAGKTAARLLGDSFARILERRPDASEIRFVCRKVGKQRFTMWFLRDDDRAVLQVGEQSGAAARALADFTGRPIERAIRGEREPQASEPSDEEKRAILNSLDAQWEGARDAESAARAVLALRNEK